MKKIKFPTLYHLGKGGAIVQWNIWTEEDTIFTQHGQIGGKMQVYPKKATGKNVGRANETTPEEQAIQEAKAMWVFKVERKYSETIKDAEEEVFLPMLCADFKKRKGKGVTYPVDVQPKLDGVRAMAYWEDDRVILGTRSGKEWTAPKHIIKGLELVMLREMVLDGELYIHGVDFESLSSWTKKVHLETSDLEYHIFDMPIDENGARLKWKNRYKNLKEFFSRILETRSNSLKPYSLLKCLKLVEVSTCTNPEGVLSAEDQFVCDGYEGAIVRNDAEYLFGHRSNDIQKVKSSQDAEFKIVGFTHGKGKDSDAVIWECVTKEGKPFECRPKAPIKKREEYYHDGDKYIGQWLKVVFQNYTKEGKPRFPRSVGFRDKRDMS